MNNKPRTAGLILTIAYILSFIVPSILPGQLDFFSTILGWVIAIIVVSAPIIYFRLYKLTQNKYYIIAATITLIILVIGIIGMISLMSNLT